MLSPIRFWYAYYFCQSLRLTDSLGCAVRRRLKLNGEMSGMKRALSKARVRRFVPAQRQRLWQSPPANFLRVDWGFC